jgi:hypothetical protein
VLEADCGVEAELGPDGSAGFVLGADCATELVLDADCAAEAALDMDCAVDAALESAPSAGVPLEAACAEAIDDTAFELALCVPLADSPAGSLALAGETCDPLEPVDVARDSIETAEAAGASATSGLGASGAEFGAPQAAIAIATAAASPRRPRAHITFIFMSVLGTETVRGRYHARRR